jgi:hypothetical protein
MPGALVTQQVQQDLLLLLLLQLLLLLTLMEAQHSLQPKGQQCQGAALLWLQDLLLTAMMAHSTGWLGQLNCPQATAALLAKAGCELSLGWHLLLTSEYGGVGEGCVDLLTYLLLAEFDMSDVAAGWWLSAPPQQCRHGLHVVSLLLAGA